MIIQTYAPDHYAVQAAAAHDYDGFYEAEMRLRAPLDYPRSDGSRGSRAATAPLPGRTGRPGVS